MVDGLPILDPPKFLAKDDKCPPSPPQDPSPRKTPNLNRPDLAGHVGSGKHWDYECNILGEEKAGPSYFITLIRTPRN